MYRILNFIYRNKKLVTIIASVVIVVLIGVVAVTASKNKSKVTDTTVAETTTPGLEESTTETPKYDKISLLTGTPIKGKILRRRPVAIMYNNISDALPHYGIYSAGVVYEAPVEGSITRLMAIFDDYDDLERMGSVRSCRLYYAQWATEYDAIYCHYGQSDYALPFLNSGKIDALSGLDGVGATVYYRTTDRVAPHNAFTGGEQIQAGIAAKGYRTNYEKDYKGHFKFAEYSKKIDLKGTFQANKIETGYKFSATHFEYNTKSNTYDRFQYGSKHIDAQNNKQLTFENIILQFCSFTYYPDGKSLDMGNVGEGTGKYITNGNGIDITWKKDTDTAITHYYDKKGTEIILNTGKTCICVIPENDQDGVVIN